MRTDATRNARAWPGQTILLFLFLAAAADNLRAQEITYFPVSGFPGSIAWGPDGKLWCTVGGPSPCPPPCIPQDVACRIPSGEDPGFRFREVFGGSDITAGPDGNMWYTLSFESRIVRITPSGTATEFFLGSLARPENITAGSDGNLWFTDSGRSLIGKITVAGAVTEFSRPRWAGSFVNTLGGITAGPDGNIWFAEGNANRIGRITSGGIITEFDLPTPHRGPRYITAGPDGNLWFTEGRGGIGKITPEGVLTEYLILSAYPDPIAITTGPDGNIWFVNRSPQPSIGRISTVGAITEFPTCAALDIAAGPDGNIWFTVSDNRLPDPGRIGRLKIAGLGACVAGSAALCLNNSRFRVQVSFRAPGLFRQDAQALPLASSDTGAFWFFDSRNLELMVKVLDGRTINGKFWVFYGSLTNVEFTLTVTDTETGAVKTYENVQGQLASAADTAAF